jgi:hypothetical protein
VAAGLPDEASRVTWMGALPGAAMNVLWGRALRREHLRILELTPNVAKTNFCC